MLDTCLWIIAFISDLLLFPDEQGVAANDSDSSPPRSRGRGRFERNRIRGVSRGQSDDTRSTSSQGNDDTESSSHVGHFIYFFWYNPYLIQIRDYEWFDTSFRVSVVGENRLMLIIMCSAAAGQVSSERQPQWFRPSLWLLSCWWRREWNARCAPLGQCQEGCCPLQMHGKASSILSHSNNKWRVLFLKGIVRPKMKINSPSGHARCRWVFLHQKCSITSLAHQWMDECPQNRFKILVKTSQ